MTVLVALMVLASATANEVPRYEEYPAAEALRGKPAEPNFGSHPEARHYRTRLRQAARAGPNFAGHFTFVRIGCGTSCVQVAVVNSKDGSVFFPRGLRQVQWAGWWHHPCGPQYRLSSRLVVVYGAANEEEGRVPYGVSYLLWNGSDFELLRFDERDRGTPPE